MIGLLSHGVNLVALCDPDRSKEGRLHPNSPRALPLCDGPVPCPLDWLDQVNQAVTGAEIDALRQGTE